VLLEPFGTEEVCSDGVVGPGHERGRGCRKPGVA
jgi:hypothetical protein